MDPVTRIMWLIGLSLGAVGITVSLLGHMPAPAPKPREFPLWCHNGQHEELSGVCSKVKVDWRI